MLVTFPAGARFRYSISYLTSGFSCFLHDVDESQKLLQKTQTYSNLITQATSESSNVPRRCDKSDQPHGYCKHRFNSYNREREAILCGTEIHQSNALINKFKEE